MTLESSFDLPSLSCRALAAACSLLLVACLLAPVIAEEAPAAAASPQRSRLDLADGTVLQGHLDLATVALQTDYGLLTIPLAEIYEIRMADRVDAELAAQIIRLVGELGDSSFEVRETAQRKLGNIGRQAVHAMEDAARAAEDLEVRARLEELIADLEIEDGGDLDPPREDDEVLARKFLARGRLVIETIAVETPYGELAIAREHIRRILVQRPPRRVSRVSIEAANTVNAGFIETGVVVEAGDRIRISATGNVFYEMWGTQFAPAGDSNFGNFSPGVPMGALVMKVDDDSPLTLVGASYDRVATRAGEVKLAIAINDRGRPTTGGGEFSVRIIVEHDLSSLEDR